MYIYIYIHIYIYIYIYIERERYTCYYKIMTRSAQKNASELQKWGGGSSFVGLFCRCPLFRATSLQVFTCPYSAISSGGRPSRRGYPRGPARRCR